MQLDSQNFTFWSQIFRQASHWLLQFFQPTLDGQVTARNGDEISVRADTLCIHGDTAGAAEKARAVRDVLESHGVEIRAHAMR